MSDSGCSLSEDSLLLIPTPAGRAVYCKECGRLEPPLDQLDLAAIAAALAEHEHEEAQP